MSRWWHPSYTAEWVVSVGAALTVGAVCRLTAPYCREFNPLDPSVGHPFSHHEVVPSWQLPLIAVVAPVVWGAVLLPLLEGFGGASLHALALSVVQAAMLAMCVTDPMKNYAGRLRPDYVSRLEEVLHFNPHNFTQADLTAACDSTVSKVMDGRRSFPSGHASLTWAGWTVVALFVYVKVFNGERRMGITFVNLLCVAVNLVVPAWVAISRTRDYRHNFGDVLAGSAIGVFAGFVCFVQHFSLSSAVCRAFGAFSPPACCLRIFASSAHRRPKTE